MALGLTYLTAIVASFNGAARRQFGAVLWFLGNGPRHRKCRHRETATLALTQSQLCGFRAFCGRDQSIPARRHICPRVKTQTTKAFMQTRGQDNMHIKHYRVFKRQLTSLEVTDDVGDGVVT